MTDCDLVEFELPLMFRGILAEDQQFEGMKRRLTITRAAILKAIDLPITGPSHDIYEEFFFDVWMRVRDDAWFKRPEGGAIRLDVEDIKDLSPSSD